jgi:2-polyprenyl-6-methoxyphenol hydroxylase-like FAD-dependent oxidoreductase
VLAELLSAAEPLGRVRPFHATANRRRYYERRPRTEGLLVLGDALAAMNPVYSHGLSVAALGVLRMDRELAAHGALPSALPAIQAAVAEEAERAWRMAVAQDSTAAAPSASASPSRARIAGRGVMSAAVLTSPRLMTELFCAQTLVAPAARGAQASAPGQGPLPSPPGADEAAGPRPPRKHSYPQRPRGGPPWLRTFR